MQFASKDDQHLQALRLAALIEQGKRTMSTWEERIVSAAVKISDQGIFTMPMPARHHHLMMEMLRAGIPNSVRHAGTQGFFTSLGRFVDREMAMTIARRAGQIISNTTNKRLFSEDLWQ